MKLWRYLDFAKYTFLIQRSELHCPRGDQFEDKFEGSYPSQNRTDFDGWEFKGEDWKQFVAVSCWHKSKYESDAMWRLYGLNKYGVAITTTEEALNKLAKENGGYVQTVEYIDFSSGKADIKIPTDVFHFKRRAFTHESEVRLIKTEYPHCGFENNMPKLSIPTKGKELPKSGLLMEVDLMDFIKAIIVSPYAEQWFHDVVIKLTNTYGLDEKLVSDSELCGDPIYAKP